MTVTIQPAGDASCIMHELTCSTSAAFPLPISKQGLLALLRNLLPDGALLLIVTGDYYKDHESFFNGGGLSDTLAAMMDSLKRGLIKDKAVAQFIGTMEVGPEPQVEVELRRIDGTVIEVEGHQVN